MSTNRLEFFRQQMSAFEGSINPSKAIESGYYVQEPRTAVSELIAGRIALRPASTHLLLGGIGSGKTTQLLMTLDRINSLLENAYVRYIDVSIFTDISKISSGVLVAIVGSLLANLMKDSEEKIIKNNIDIVRKLSYGYSEIKVKRERIGKSVFDLDYLFGESVLKEVEHNYPGILSPESGQHSNKLIRAVTELCNLFKDENEYKQIIFLFDGLDRLDDTQSFSHLIVNDMRDLSAMGIGCVVVGSARALYEEYKNTLEQAVDYLGYQSCLDVENDQAAYDFFVSILENRASENFIDSDVMERIIIYSGGVLRDLINITQSSIEESYLSGDDRLMTNHVEKAVESFGRAKLLGLKKSDIDILREFAEGRLLLPSSDREIKLLIAGRIIEYKYPARRCVVHPALLPMLISAVV
jgi:Cdc6-like AAA superfamily ATPase